MQPREFNYLQDMLNAAKLAQDFVAGIDWTAFEIDLCRSYLMLVAALHNSEEPQCCVFVQRSFT